MSKNLSHKIMGGTILGHFNQVARWWTIREIATFTTSLAESTRIEQWSKRVLKQFTGLTKEISTLRTTSKSYPVCPRKEPSMAAFGSAVCSSFAEAFPLSKSIWACRRTCLASQPASPWSSQMTMRSNKDGSNCRLCTTLPACIQGWWLSKIATSTNSQVTIKGVKWFAASISIILSMAGRATRLKRICIKFLPIILTS